MEVVVLGSINMDLVIETDDFPVQGETVIGKSFFTSPGGKGANQATALAKMQVKTRFIGCVGDDSYGSKMLKLFENNGIETEDILIVEKNTGVALIIVYDKDNRIILDQGANHLLQIKQVKNALEKVGKEAVFLTQFENNINVVEYGLKQAKKKGMLTVLNPAPFVKTNKSIYCGLDLLVLNQSECEALTNITLNNSSDYKKVLLEIEKMGVKRVVLTLGNKGSILYEDNIMHHIKAYPTNTVDTTCAGDSYIGALISKLTINCNYLDACNFAAKIASIAVSKKGAQNSIPTLKEYQMIYE